MLYELNSSKLFELNSSEKTVLETIRKYDCSLKSRIVEKANLPWTTVATAITSLISKGWVIKEKKNKDVFYLNSSKTHFIGISIGTSNIKISFTNLSCQELNANTESEKEFINNVTEDFKKIRLENAYDSKSPINSDLHRSLWCFVTPDNYVELSFLLSEICKVLLQQTIKYKMNVSSICFVFPGHIDIKSQTIVFSKYSNLVIQASNIQSLLDNDILNIINDLKIKLYIDHNVKASTSYELSSITKRLEDRFFGNLAVIYLGYGLGMGIALDGRLCRGENGSNLAGQFGHINMSIVSDTFIENYFHNMDLDSIKSTTIDNLKKLEDILREEILFKLVDQNYNNTYNKEKIKKKYKETRISVLRDNLSEYDSIYRKKFAYYLGTAICNIVKILSINRFVFSGKLAELYPIFKVELQYVIMKNDCQTNIDIIISENGEFSASLGAAEMAYRNIFEIMDNLE